MTVIVGPSAALQLSKQHVGTFTVGSDASYRLTVRNTGLTESPGPVVITDQLPAGLTYRGFAGTGWACTADAQCENGQCDLIPLTDPQFGRCK